MATYTTNLNLKKPATSDKIRIADFNNNSDLIDSAYGDQDTSMGKLGGGMAIIATGNVHSAITAGQFVYVRKHNDLTEGLYTADSNISANGTLSASNLSAVSGGGLNTVVDAMGLFVQSRITRSDTQATTITVTNNSRHFMIISGTNAPSRTAVLMIASANNGGITIAEIYKGSNITVSTGTNLVTITKDTETATFFADFAMNGEFAVIADVI